MLRVCHTAIDIHPIHPGHRSSLKTLAVLFRVNVTYSLRVTHMMMLCIA